MATITLQVAAGLDDAGESRGSTGYFGTGAGFPNDIGDEAVGYEKEGFGARFLGATIPPGSLITSAYLTLTARYSNAPATVKARISAEGADNPGGFSTKADFDARFNTHTTARIDWDAVVAEVLNTTYNSPDISAVIQEIVDRPGWASGNSIVIFGEDFDGRSSSGAKRGYYDYEMSAPGAPILVITYSMTMVTHAATAIGVNQATLNGEIANLVAPNADYEGFRISPIANMAAAVVVNDGVGFWDTWGHICQMSNGSLLMVYTKNTIAGFHYAIYGTISADKGATWGAPFAIYDVVGHGSIGAYATTLSNGDILVAGAQETEPGVTLTGTIILKSINNGATWNTLTVFTPAGFKLRYQVTDALMELTPGGNLLMVMIGYETLISTHFSVHTYISADHGATWGSEATMADGDADAKDYEETGIVNLGGGNIYALIRPGDPPYQSLLLQCSSANSGVSWGAISNSTITGIGPASIEKLASGVLVAGFRRYDAGSDDLRYTEYTFSPDNGATWEPYNRIDLNNNRNNYCGFVELPDRMLAMVASEVVSSNNTAFMTFKHIAPYHVSGSFGNGLFADLLTNLLAGTQYWFTATGHKTDWIEGSVLNFTTSLATAFKDMATRVKLALHSGSDIDTRALLTAQNYLDIATRVILVGAPSKDINTRVNLITTPLVTTNPASGLSLGGTTALLNGILNYDGNEPPLCGFEWGTTIAYGNVTPTTVQSSGQTFQQGIIGLTPSIPYHFRAFAQNSAGTVYGADRTVTTPTCQIVLRPIGPGDLTECTPNAGPNWVMVSDVVPDEDLTTVANYDPFSTSRTDLYQFAQLPPGTLSVSAVTIFARTRKDHGNTLSSQIKLKTGGVIFTGHVNYDAMAFSTWGDTYYVNPLTGNPWTPAEVNALQVGIMLGANPGGFFGDTHGICTQIFITTLGVCPPIVFPTVQTNPATGVL